MGGSVHWGVKDTPPTGTCGNSVHTSAEHVFAKQSSMFKQLYSNCSHLYSTQRAPLYFSLANLVIVLYHISFLSPDIPPLFHVPKTLGCLVSVSVMGSFVLHESTLLLVAHDQNHYSLSPFLCYNAKNHGQRIPCLWPPGWSCRSNVLFNGVEVMGAL